MNSDDSDRSDMSSRVNKQMQDKTFEKAKNYVGNNVVLKDG